MKKKIKKFFIKVWVYMQLLYNLLCACQFIYKYRYLKAEVIKTNFLGKGNPQVYLEKCKYRTEKI